MTSLIKALLCTAGLAVLSCSAHAATNYIYKQAVTGVRPATVSAAPEAPPVAPAAPVPVSCTLPWGGTLAESQAVPAYAQSQVQYGQSCSSETRVCSSAGLSGSYAFASCSVSAPADCTTPWGAPLAHGASLAAYSAAIVSDTSTCSTVAITLSCTNGVLSNPTAVQSCALGDLSYSSVKALLHFDNGTTDEKGGTFTHSGSVILTSNPKFGTGAAYFSGGSAGMVGPALSLPGDFTLEGWFNPVSIAGFRPLLAQWKQTTGSSGFILGLNSGHPIFHFGAYDENNALMNASGVTVATGTWSHMAVTRQGSTFRMFLNGTLVASATYAGAGRTLSIPFTLAQYYNSAGALGAATASGYLGTADDVRLTDGVARYTANFSVPTRAFSNQ